MAEVSGQLTGGEGEQQVYLRGKDPLCKEERAKDERIKKRSRFNEEFCYSKSEEVCFGGASYPD